MGAATAFTFRPIGIVRSPYAATGEVPKGLGARFVGYLHPG